MATTSFQIAASPTMGVLTAFNATTGQVTYTPNNNYVGSDSFTYDILCDGVVVDTATVNISIAAQTGVQTITNASGGAPDLNPKCGQAIQYKSTTVFIPATPAIAPITYAWSTDNAGAVVSGGTTDTATVTFAPGLVGNVGITVVQVTPFETLTTTIVVSVKCADAVNDTVSTFANTSVTISLSTNDVVCN